MGIKFKQIDNLQSTFNTLSGDLQGQIIVNKDDVSGVYNNNQTLSGWKYFDNNVDISGQQGLLVGTDNIYTPNNLIAGGAKIGFPISTPRNSTPAPLGALQVTGGQIYFEDQLNIRNNAGINIENGSISGNSGVFHNSLTLGGNPVLTGVEGSFVASGLSTDEMTGINPLVNGMVIYNTDVKKFAGYSNNSWNLLQEGWSPQQSNLNAWYDAADLSTFDLSGNYVSVWRDKSFKGNHVLQSNTGQQPIAYENSRKGLNVLAFSPNDTLISNSSTIQDQDQTWMIVIKPTEIDSVNDGFLSYYDNNSSNLSGAWQLESASVSAFFGKIRKGTSANTVPTTNFSGPDQNGNYIMLEWDFDRQNLQHSSWFNGAYNDSGISDITGIVPNMNIKVMTNRNDNQFPGGEVAEIICFSGVLSNEDRQRAEGYLAHKWNFTSSLNSSHPYKYIQP